jgi:ferredoxin
LLNGILKKGLATVIVGDDEYREAMMAAKNCPVKIIKVNKQ